MTVSVDFDGTLCLGLDFEIKNKTPNTILIGKINYLKSKGNYIKIVTARGSYNTSIEERTKKYYNIIKDYLDKNGVNYDEISFNKEFADIYIDDLAIRPEEVTITKDLSSSFTDNVVTRINDTVIKSGKTIEKEYEWYKSYLHKKDIPEILNVTRHSIVYKYIESYGKLNYDSLFDKIDRYKDYDPLNNLTFNSYIININDHIISNQILIDYKKLIYMLQEINIEPSFAHGDLSITNIIPTENGIKFIDPLYNKDKFGSYIIDFAKLLFSVKFYLGDVKLFEELKSKINIGYIDTLIASECVRVASYKQQYNFIAENLINEL